MGPLFLALATVFVSDEMPALEIGGGRIEISLSGALSVPPGALQHWIEDAARAVTSYYGRFPVPRLRLAVRAGGRGRVGRGVTYGGDSPTIRISVGERTTETDLSEDWVLTHEMVHLAFPEMGSDYAWMGEGLATYVEPIARASVGTYSEADVWKELVLGLPKGRLGASGERGGLDGTRSWGRTYWGGALFWLLADVEIRQGTSGKRGLPDALRGILAAGGDVREEWSLERVLSTGDRATGTDALERLHARMGRRPAEVDLDALWKKLGVSYREGAFTFEDQAPLASVRRAITKRAVTQP